MRSVERERLVVCPLSWFAVVLAMQIFGKQGFCEARNTKRKIMKNMIAYLVFLILKYHKN